MDKEEFKDILIELDDKYGDELDNLKDYNGTLCIDNNSPICELIGNSKYYVSKVYRAISEILDKPIIRIEGSELISGYVGSENHIISIPKYITSIGSAAFMFEHLTSIIIPDMVKTIGHSAFYGCKILESISMSKSIVSIKDEAFLNCNSLKSIDIPGSVVSIGNRSFLGCGLKNITLPEKFKNDLKRIGIDEKETKVIFI